MRTDHSWTVISRVPGVPPGMRRFSNVTKKLLAAFALMLVASGTSVYAAEGPYVGVGGSLSILNDASVTASAGDYPALDANATTKNGFAVRGGRLRLSQRLTRGGRDRLPPAQDRRHVRQEPGRSCGNPSSRQLR